MVDTSPQGQRPPYRSILLGLIALQSSGNIAQVDIPAAVAGRPDVFGTFVDAAICAWCTNNLLQQAGVLKPRDAGVSLDGFAARVTLRVGREPGTWMPPDWGTSGARLSLPLTVRFTEDPVDLGFPGEETFGGPYAKRLVVEPGSFIGLQGEVVVKPTGGAYILQPTSLEGVNVMRFFIDFPEEVKRNDVTLPAGRVFFSSSLLSGSKAVGGLGEALGLPDGEALGSEVPDLVDGPGDIKFLGEGGLTIKGNSWRNLFGLLGDVNLILGRYTFAAAEQDKMPKATTYRSAQI